MPDDLLIPRYRIYLIPFTEPIPHLNSNDAAGRNSTWRSRSRCISFKPNACQLQRTSHQRRHRAHLFPAHPSPPTFEPTDAIFESSFPTIPTAPGPHSCPCTPASIFLITHAAEVPNAANAYSPLRAAVRAPKPPFPFLAHHSHVLCPWSLCD